MRVRYHQILLNFYLCNYSSNNKTAISNNLWKNLINGFKANFIHPLDNKISLRAVTMQSMDAAILRSIIETSIEIY